MSDRMVRKWARACKDGHDDYDSVKKTVFQWLSHQATNFYDEGKKPLLFDMISALILEEIIWKSRLKCGLLWKNKTVTIFLLVFYTSKR